MDKLWLNHYQKGVPPTIDPDQYPSLNALFSHSFKTYPNNPSFTNAGSSLSFTEVEQNSNALASYLQQLHLAKGARVAIMMPNLLQYPIAIIAILRAGLVIVNTNPLYTPDELTHQLDDAKAEVIIILSQFAHTLQEALPNLPCLKHIIITDIGDCFSPFKRTVTNFIVNNFKFRGEPFSIPQAKRFIDVLRLGSTRPLEPEHSLPEDIAFLQYTGGTTGVSKGAMLTHRNIIANVLQAGAWISQQNIGPEDIIITALPLYHIFSLLANCLLFFHLGVENILITNPRDTEGLLKQIHKTPPTAFTGVNTLYSSLLSHSKFNPLDFQHLKIALSGGMALQQTIAELWLQKTKKPLIEAYGLTETSPAVCINPLGQPSHPGSIGLPIPSTELSIRDELGHECPPGIAGELCVRGPQVMKGYWQHPEETAHVFWNDGFLRTGDSAHIDEDGFVYLVDRIKDLIIVSGFNVYPSEVEQVIAKMPQVLEVGVVGQKTKSGNERIKACIVRRDPTLTSEEVIAFCRQHLTGYKIPKVIEFYSELPKTNVGKILRRMLK